ncbi:hypothetical protein AVMA1855_22660 [Acidovorax sp. SUPP1855]|uniref:hypothetical protein n=1 Tax=Acidovorax sp. SUPP1855 TaxID=431774 RepID=UPI0023DE44F4|nr:hypothetical protein [Acidovorax sp. SUPP1855]GKS87006.1 hypothetical protein AVMA1855_22660 [Acidovorax sp. SUPP1855]
MKVSNKKSAIAAGLVATVLCIVAGAAGAAGAQERGNIKFPAELKWKLMPLVTFNSRQYISGNPEEKRLLEPIWKENIDSTPLNLVRNDGSRLGSFILYQTHENKENRYIFTMFSAFESKCEPPPNGPFAQKGYVPPMYSICPMRVIVEDKSTGRRKQKDFPNYCHLSIDDENTPLAQNHTEFAFDDKTGSAYFRVIQYGKRVPECDRALHLG